MTDALTIPWRVGRTVGRTIYAQPGDQPHNHDPLIGLMDTPQLAENAVHAHNALLDLQKDWETEH
jgi:hypothetical protein